MPLSQPTAEELFDMPGEQFPVGLPTDSFDIREFFEESPRLELSEGFYDYLHGLSSVYTPRSKRNMKFLDLRRQATQTKIEKSIGPMREIEFWMFADTVHQELTTQDGSLIGGGRMNLFWIPAPVVLFEEESDGKWHIEVSSPRAFEKFDRIFFS